MQGIATLPYEVQTQPMVPIGGLETMQSAAKMLADFGREGDTYIVHAAEGETVIPLEVLEANPRMKNMIFQQMEDMGLEPERYVVGSEFNSLNPVTGQPEFFFKKLFRGIKKVAKKVAPAVLPIALSFVAGPIYGAALGSGITTLLQGGSIKDAAKSALISGGLGALGAGIGSKVGGGGFFEGIQKAALNPLEAAAAQREAFGNLFKSGAGDPSPFAKGGADTPITDLTQPPKVDLNQYAADLGVPGPDTPIPEVPTGGTSETITKTGPEKSFIEKYIYDPAPAQFDAATGQVTGEGTLEGIFSSNRSSLDPGIQQQLVDAKTQQALANIDPTSKIAAETAAQIKAQGAKKAAEAAALDPGFFSKYGPALGTAGTAAGVYGIAQLFPDDNPDDENQDGYHDTTGVMLYRDQPEMYGFANFYGDNPYYQDPTFTPEAFRAAGGGPVNGPGTSTSDSIPAMLSDGEFVMNAKAVRGAGDGDRRAGAKRMYDMMRKFERMA